MSFADNIKAIPITDYAERCGFTLVSKGQRYVSLREHDSVMIDTYKNCFYRNSVFQSGRSGGAGSIIDFAMEFMGYDHKEAMRELATAYGISADREPPEMEAKTIHKGYTVIQSSYNHHISVFDKNGKRVFHAQANGRKTEDELKGILDYMLSKTETKTAHLELPPKADNMKAVYRYLLGERKIDQSVVRYFTAKGMLYQDAKYKNCVFVSQSKRFACLRSTSGKRFAVDVKGCDYNECFFFRPSEKAKTLVVAESVIDVMSIMTQFAREGKRYTEYSYLALTGTNKLESLFYHLEKEGDFSRVMLAFDNDAAGQRAQEAAVAGLNNRNFNGAVEIFTSPAEKDWNEYIKSTADQFEPGKKTSDPHREDTPTEQTKAERNMVEVQSAVRSNYEGYVVLCQFDRDGTGGVEEKVFLGKAENYDNQGNYDNSDNSLVFITDNLKLDSFLSGEGWILSQQKMFEEGLFTEVDYAEYAQLKEGVLKQFESRQIREVKFSVDEEVPGSGEPFRYPDWEGREQTIKPFRGDYSYLSNFFDAVVVYDGITYRNNEAAFQAQKEADKEKREAFSVLTPQEAKRQGRRVNLRPDWEDVKERVMYEICKAKFEQHPELMEKLLSTGERPLEEANTWNDRVWGTVNGEGENKLGKILMRVRSEARKQEQEVRNVAQELQTIPIEEIATLDYVNNPDRQGTGGVFRDSAMMKNVFDHLGRITVFGDGPTTILQRDADVYQRYDGAWTEALLKDDFQPKIAILQLQEGEGNHNRAFLGMEQLHKILDEEPNCDNYELVYVRNEGLENVHPEFFREARCNELYAEFNAPTLRPRDYYGHSLSVGDVIVFMDDFNEHHAYFVDSVGFTKLPDEFLTHTMSAKIRNGLDVREESALYERISGYQAENAVPIMDDAAQNRYFRFTSEYAKIFELADRRGMVMDMEALGYEYDFEPGGSSVHWRSKADPQDRFSFVDWDDVRDFLDEVTTLRDTYSINELRSMLEEGINSERAVKTVIAEFERMERELGGEQTNGYDVNMDKKVEYKGYTAVQSSYNHHVSVYDADGERVFHVTVEQEKTEDELKKIVDNYLAFHETIDKYLDEMGIEPDRENRVNGATFADTELWKKIGEQTNGYDVSSIADILASEEENRYRILSRMKQDCDYYLGYGNRAAKHLWAKSEAEQIAYMVAIHNSFSDDKKPEWLSMDDIHNYAVKMLEPNRESIPINNLAFDEDNYLHFTVEVDGYELEGLFRVYDPANGEPMKIVSIDYGNRHPMIEAHWDDIEERLKDIARDRFNELTKELMPDPSVTAEEMAEYGYQSTTMYPLRAEAAQRLWAEADVPVYRLYEDGTEGMVESVEEFAQHSAQGGLFGIESEDWAVAQERQKESAVIDQSENNNTFQVYIVSGGGTKREFISFETEQKTIDFCEQNHWVWKDENGFVWDLEYEEKEIEVERLRENPHRDSVETPSFTGGTFPTLEYISVADTATGWPDKGEKDYGAFDGYLRGYNVEFRHRETGEINYGSAVYVNGTIESYYQHQMDEWGYLGFTPFEMERSNGYEPTGRAVFRGYATEHYDPEERDTYVEDATEEVEKLMRDNHYVLKEDFDSHRPLEENVVDVTAELTEEQRTTIKAMEAAGFSFDAQANLGAIGRIVFRDADKPYDSYPTAFENWDEARDWIESATFAKMENGAEVLAKVQAILHPDFEPITFEGVAGKEYAYGDYLYEVTNVDNGVVYLQSVSSNLHTEIPMARFKNKAIDVTTPLLSVENIERRMKVLPFNTAERRELSDILEIVRNYDYAAVRTELNSRENTTGESAEFPESVKDFSYYALARAERVLLKQDAELAERVKQGDLFVEVWERENRNMTSEETKVVYDLILDKSIPLTELNAILQQCLDGEGSEQIRYDENSFHEGDYYEDAHGKGVITEVYQSQYEGRHEAMFSYVDPEAVKGSRDAKGYAMMMDAAIERLNRGEAKLTPKSEFEKANRNEAVYRMDDGSYLHVQVSEGGYDYTLYDKNMKELDGGQLDNPDLTIDEACAEILLLHELSPSEIESVSLDSFEEMRKSAEQLVSLTLRLDEVMRNVYGGESPAGEIERNLLLGNVAGYTTAINAELKGNSAFTEEQREDWAKLEADLFDFVAPKEAERSDEREADFSVIAESVPAFRVSGTMREIEIERPDEGEVNHGDNAVDGLIKDALSESFERMEQEYMAPDKMGAMRENIENSMEVQTTAQAQRIADLANRFDLNALETELVERGDDAGGGIRNGDLESYTTEELRKAAELVREYKPTPNRYYEPDFGFNATAGELFVHARNGYIESPEALAKLQEILSNPVEQKTEEAFYVGVLKEIAVDKGDRPYVFAQMKKDILDGVNPEEVTLRDGLTLEVMREGDNILIAERENSGERDAAGATAVPVERFLNMTAKEFTEMVNAVYAYDMVEEERMEEEYRERSVEVAEQDKKRVAIESTDDYADTQFHQNLVDADIRNEDGSYGKVVDYYRIVTIGEDARLHALDERIFVSAEEARVAVKGDSTLELVSYDDLVHEAGEKMAETRVKNPYNEKNFRIDSADNGAFVVRSDSDRFGNGAVVFESHNREECLDYIAKRRGESQWEYYLIADIKTWATNEESGNRSKLERFSDIASLKARYNELRGQGYNFEENDINPQTNEPYARLTIGISCKNELSDSDILHVRGGQNFMVDDFTRKARVNTDRTAMELISSVYREIGFDMVRPYNAERGDFVTWNNRVTFNDWQKNDTVFGSMFPRIELPSDKLAAWFDRDTIETELDARDGTAAEDLRNPRLTRYTDAALNRAIKLLDERESKEREENVTQEYNFDPNTYDFNVDPAAAKLVAAYEAATDIQASERYTSWSGGLNLYDKRPDVTREQYVDRINDALAALRMSGFEEWSKSELLRGAVEDIVTAMQKHSHATEITDRTQENSSFVVPAEQEQPLLNAGSDGIKVEGHEGTWYVIETDVVDGKSLFLLESERYGDEAAHLIVDEHGKLVMEDVYNGFDDYYEAEGIEPSDREEVPHRDNEERTEDGDNSSFTASEPAADLTPAEYARTLGSGTMATFARQAGVQIDTSSLEELDRLQAHVVSYLTVNPGGFDENLSMKVLHACEEYQKQLEESMKEQGQEVTDLSDAPEDVKEQIFRNAEELERREQQAVDYRTDPVVTKLVADYERGLINRWVTDNGTPYPTSELLVRYDGPNDVWEVKWGVTAEQFAERVNAAVKDLGFESYEDWNRAQEAVYKESAPVAIDESLSPKDQLQQRLENGIRSVLDSEKFKNWLSTGGKLFYNNYSFRNAMLVWLQKPDASYVMGYEKWKDFGRNVAQGAQGAKVFVPIMAYEKSKGGLFKSIKRNLTDQLSKDPALDMAVYRVGTSKLEFTMNRANRAIGIKIGGVEKEIFGSEEDAKRFLERYVIGKLPTGYTVGTVFDAKDVIVPDHLWVKSGFTKDEVITDEKGNPIKNRRGETKIVNTPERQARFQTGLDTRIAAKDPEKMQALFDACVAASERKGVPVSLVDAADDETLKGAKGYYSREFTEEKPNGFIVIDNSLEITEKCATLLHEMGHADLHKNLEALAEKMGEEKISKQMREVQAEAVSFAVASTFGIDTDTSSFNYLAAYSRGFELQDFQKSLQVIYKEAQALTADIKAELDIRGLNLDLTEKPKEMLDKETLKTLSTKYMDFATEQRETVQAALTELPNLIKQSTDNPELMDILKYQKENLNSRSVDLDIILSGIESLNIVDTREAQDEVVENIEAAMNRVGWAVNAFENLSEGYITAYEQARGGLKVDFDKDPVKTLEAMKKDYPALAKLSGPQLQYIATSKFVSREFAKLLRNEPQSFVDKVTERAALLSKVAAKNGTFVEVNFCEQWTESPIFENGTLCSPKIADVIVSGSEAQIRGFMAEAEKRGEYFPYTKCDLTIYTPTKDGGLKALNTRVDIGDGTQTSLKDHLEQVCQRGAERKELLANFQEALAERAEKGKIQVQNISVKPQKTEKPEQEVASERSMTRKQWAEQIKAKKEQDGEELSEKAPEKSRSSPDRGIDG